MRKKKVVALAAAMLVLLLAGCIADSHDPADAAEIIQVELPASAQDTQSDIATGRDGTFVNLEFTIPTDTWNQYVAQYPTITLTQSEASCVECSYFSREERSGKPFYYGSDEIQINHNGEQQTTRKLTVIPDEATGRTWIIWSNS
ncbi:hypothetical protein VZC37_15655 [Gordonia sp. LSe1-13]|uniref:Lipoprotein n=1 Tax=Gordonia sesuvii TaxID=3116777 RepID=A0ABU7MFA0_9ACTN|nr:hypothetical protein [Gordonia sp. LSe1-13]